MISAYPWSMDKELSEHTFKLNDNEALEQLKILFEFTTPYNLKKSLNSTLFAYLKENSESGLDSHFKQVVVDFELLLEFLDKLESE